MARTGREPANKLSHAIEAGSKKLYSLSIEIFFRRRSFAAG
jgi:hypothetical protein